MLDALDVEVSCTGGNVSQSHINKRLEMWYLI